MENRTYDQGNLMPDYVYYPEGFGFANGWQPVDFPPTHSSVQPRIGLSIGEQLNMLRADLIELRAGDKAELEMVQAKLEELKAKSDQTEPELKQAHGRLDELEEKWEKMMKRTERLQQSASEVTQVILRLCEAATTGNFQRFT